jgi:hypothetical protein
MERTGGQEVTDKDKLFADLWMRQTDIFLKLVSLMPVIELGILAGWYKLISDGMNVLALLAAVVGVIVMLIAFLYLYRATVYIEYFLDQVPLLRAPPTIRFGRKLTGRIAGLSVPVLCAGVNLLLAFASPFIVFQ